MVAGAKQGLYVYVYVYVYVRTLQLCRFSTRVQVGISQPIKNMRMMKICRMEMRHEATFRFVSRRADFVAITKLTPKAVPW